MPRSAKPLRVSPEALQLIKFNLAGGDESPAERSMARKAKKRQSGRESHKMGHDWQAIIDAENVQHVRAGRGVVVKLEAPSRVVRAGGVLRVIYSERGGADYIGHLHAIPVAFEAKTTDTIDTYTVPPKKEFQLDWLKSFSSGFSRPIFVGYYIYWKNSQERRFHPLDSFIGRSTRRSEGWLVQSWYDAFALWRNRHGITL